MRVTVRISTAGSRRDVDDKTLGFADFGGNRQFITLGNLAENPKAFIFLMDYARSRRSKLWGQRLASWRTTLSCSTDCAIRRMPSCEWWLASLAL